MSKGGKKTSRVLNDGRPNGKKFKKLRETDELGRPKTGRGKPTGRTVKGMKIK